MNHRFVYIKEGKKITGIKFLHNETFVMDGVIESGQSETIFMVTPAEILNEVKKILVK